MTNPEGGESVRTAFKAPDCVGSLHRLSSAGSHPPPNFVGKIEHECDVIFRLLVLRPEGRHERQDAPPFGGKIEVRENAGVSQRVPTPFSCRW